MQSDSGDEAVQRRLHKVDHLADWTARTPGACNGGRVMATDAYDRLGWESIDPHLEEDGVFVFRYVLVEDVPALEAAVAARGATLHIWSLFYGRAGEIAAARRPRRDLPVDICLSAEERPSPETVAEAMGFLSGQGIMPYTARNLAGEISPSTLVTARAGPDGPLRAVAFGHFASNRYSPWHRTAWCGLVAVAPEARGIGLGRAVNDAAIGAMIGPHGAEAVVEFAAPDNRASRAMIEGSGLVLREDILSCAATRGAARFTR